MQAYIKRKSDFGLAVYGPVLSWDLPLASASSATGTLTIPSVISREHAGDWLIVEGRVYAIERVEPDTALSTLTVSLPEDAFDRALVYDGDNAPAATGSLILRTLRDEYQQCPDSAYALPYLDIRNSDDTPLIDPEPDENGLWSLSSYLRRVRARGVAVDWTVAGQLLRVTIRRTSAQDHTVLFGAGDYQLAEQAYSRSLTAKVTIRQGGTSTHYYLSQDGSISTSIPDRRAAGEWQVAAVRDKADPLEEAAKIFAANQDSHKISFRTAEGYALYDIIRFRLSGQPYTAAITDIRWGSGDRRLLYTCGELTTTLEARLRSSGSIQALGGVSAKGGAVDGNMAILGRTTMSDELVLEDDLTVAGQAGLAGTIVLGAGSCGDRLPTEGLVPGRLFFLRGGGS